MCEVVEVFNGGGTASGGRVLADAFQTLSPFLTLLRQRGRQPRLAAAGQADQAEQRLLGGRLWGWVHGLFCLFFAPRA